MAFDLATLRDLFPKTVPMVGTLDLEFEDMAADRMVMRLPDQAPYHNHIAGPHAGAMFTLGESASGAIVMANFGDRLGEVTPLAVEARIRYLRVAKGDVTATATLDRPASEIIDQLDAGERPEFAVSIAIADADGNQTGEMTVIWTLKPVRR